MGRVRASGLALGSLSLVLASVVETTAALQGFGAQTKGGTGGATYVVTSLADSGPGTLRDAVSSSSRVVVFAVEGTIRLQSSIRVLGSYLTIDGSTAPGGITVTAAQPTMKDALVRISNVRDVIVRHLRFRDAPDPLIGDNLRITGTNAFNIVIDHCSFRRGGDGALDISDGAHDLTVQWSILADTVKTQLIRTNVSRISLHHNLYVHGDERDPQLDGAADVDIVNNVIYDWATNYGTRIRNRSSANLVKNYYLPGPRSDAKDAVVISSDSLVYSAGNVLPPGASATGLLPLRRPAPALGETSAAQAFDAVIESAGALPRDAEDEAFVADVLALE